MTGLIEVKLTELNQLFNSMDPSPFHEKDLDDDAEEFIVSWAREHALDTPLTLRIHLEEWPVENPSRLVREGVHHYFAYRGKLIEHDFSIERGELTPTLKVKRRVIDKTYKAQIDELYVGAD